MGRGKGGSYPCVLAKSLGGTDFVQGLGAHMLVKHGVTIFAITELRLGGHHSSRGYTSFAHGRG